MSERQSLRTRAGGRIAAGFFESLAATRALPIARPDRHGVEVIRDVPYRDTGLAAHRLDVYRPQHRRGPTPTVVYIHGGAFRTLSKETHWIFGLGWARRGYTVFNVEYRLAPTHPYPAALEDVSAALLWVLDHGARYGADPGRLILAGESAGANLATGLAIAAHFERPEPYARAVFDRNPAIAGVAPACGILQVTEPERFWADKNLHPFLQDRIREVATSYLRGVDDAPLADPLVLLESDAAAARPLPPFFAPVGTADPIEDDTLRLGTALERRGVPVTVERYDRGMHAFHAFVWRREARRCWDEMLQWSDAVTAG